MSGLNYAIGMNGDIMNTGFFVVGCLTVGYGVYLAMDVNPWMIPMGLFVALCGFVTMYISLDDDLL